MKTFKVVDTELEAQIEEGAKLTAEIKWMTEELKAIKENMGSLDVGKYLTESKKTVTISQSPKYTAINPRDAKQALRDKRLGRNFMDCVTIGVTKLTRFLSDQEMSALREVVDYTRKYSFK